MPKEPSAYIIRMLQACENTEIPGWDTVKPHAENEFRGLLLMLDWLNKMQRDSEMSPTLARIHVDIQKNTMRTRLMALPGITLVLAEQIITGGIDSIRKDLYAEMEQVII
jgi:hypothetical protein